MTKEISYGNCYGCGQETLGINGKFWCSECKPPPKKEEPKPLVVEEEDPESELGSWMKYIKAVNTLEDLDKLGKAIGECASNNNIKTKLRAHYINRKKQLERKNNVQTNTECNESTS